MSYQELINKLWSQYYNENPWVQKLYDAFLTKEQEVINDHIALRTFDDPRVDIEVLAKPFLADGYEQCGEYDFPVKKLYARHYEHSDAKAPKVFISQLLTSEFSPELQTTVANIIQQIPEGLLKHPAKLLLSGAVWQPLKYEVYKKLLTESEYAAWMYAFGYRANHFTVAVNELETFASLQEVNEFIKNLGFELNDAGGEIKGTPDDLLEQSSIRAVEVPVQFEEGTYNIPLCYYEFARRYPDKNGKLYSGFVAASADKLFQSTDVNR